MSGVVNLLVIVAIGVIIANLVAPGNIAGTNAILGGVANIWSTSVRGMLGHPTVYKAA